MMTKAQRYDEPFERPLKAYAFDPSQGRNLGNYMTVSIRNEPLSPGPIGKYLAIIDYDASNDCYYEPVDLNDPSVLVRGGLEPSESDPRFHQQMVYAVASETIRRFEFALGRRAGWGFRGGAKDDPHRSRLRIFPHAMQEANAYYSRDLRALVFGYFPASDIDAGASLPGQTVFTCLSHDIVVHETTHALIDGQRRFFMEPTGPDTPAFHEAFADIVALFQHFSYKEALIEMIQKTGGLIYRLNVTPDIAPGAEGPLIASELSTANPLVQLARQFGEAMGMRRALRQALGTRPNSKELQRLFEPHERGAILVAAIFDAFFSVYVRRTRDLMRIARATGAQFTPDNLHPDLANRLAEEAAKIAGNFSNICIRALDYCPPIDILFGDFLRALITADHDLVPNDRYEYRAAFIEAFRLRGIRPEYVVSYSEESLLWCPPEEMKNVEPPVCKGLKFDVFSLPTPGQQRENAVLLSRFGRNNARALGLRPNVPVQAHSFHPLHRVGPDGRLHVEIVAELMQQTELKLDPKNRKSPNFTFRGGTTVLLDREGKVRYAIQKNLGVDNHENERLARQRKYYLETDAMSGLTTYLGPSRIDGRPMNFNLIHRGY